MTKFKQQIIDSHCKNCCDHDICMGDGTHCTVIEDIINMCDVKAEEISKMDRFKLIRKIRKHNPRLKFTELIICKISRLRELLVMYSV